MLWSALDLRGYALRAIDGALGKIENFLFDDREWVVRYAVADTGGWLTGRRVLIAPHALGPPDPGRREIPVALTRRQVEHSPPIDTDQPVSRQMEAKLHHWYGWAPYFGGHAYFAPGGIPPGRVPPAGEEIGEGSPNLRGMEELKGYKVAARDGDAGLVKEFQVDDEGWKVRYLVVDAGGWITGRAVAIATDWVRDIDWAERQVAIDVTREQVEASPLYEPTQGIDRDFERRLYGHYGRTPYW